MTLSKSQTAVNALVVLYVAQDDTRALADEREADYEAACVATALYLRATLKARTASAVVLADAGKAHKVANPGTRAGVCYGTDVQVADAARVGRVLAFAVGSEKGDARPVLTMVQDVRKAREILGASKRASEDFSSVDEILSACEKVAGMTRGQALARLADESKASQADAASHEADGSEDAPEGDAPEGDAPESTVPATFAQMVAGASALLREGYDLTDEDAALVATFFGIYEAARVAV